MFRFAAYGGPGEGRGARSPGGLMSHRLIPVRTSAVLSLSSLR